MRKHGAAARRRSPLRAVAAAGAVLVALGAPPARPLVAKEPTAGCPELPALLARLRSSLLLASIQRTRGSSMAAYEVLRANAASVAEDRSIAACGIVPEVFRRALRNAASAPTAMEASLRLDLGFAAALAVALGGRMPVDDVEIKTIDVAESVNFGDDCPDIFRLAQKLAGRDGTPAERAAAVLGDLRRQPRCARLRSALEAAAPAGIAQAVESVILDEAELTPTSPLTRCPELPVVLERMTAAVGLGAPLFNKGDHEGCRRLYAFTARTLTTAVIPAGRCPVVRAELDAAVREAEVAPTAGEAAWALRRGFDRIAEALSPADSPKKP
jgi:hypothetical protein